MISTVKDLLYLVGVDQAKDLSKAISANVGRPVWVAVLNGGIELGPMLDDAEKNRENAVRLTFPMTEEVWEACVESLVDEKAVRSAITKAAKGALVLTDLVDVPVCMLCGVVLPTGQQYACRGCSR